LLAGPFFFCKCGIHGFPFQFCTDPLLPLGPFLQQGTQKKIPPSPVVVMALSSPTTFPLALFFLREAFSQAYNRVVRGGFLSFLQVISDAMIPHSPFPVYQSSPFSLSFWVFRRLRMGSYNIFPLFYSGRWFSQSLLRTLAKSSFLLEREVGSVFRFASS